jgi:Tol biopolymer transport system component
MPIRWLLCSKLIVGLLVVLLVAHCGKIAGADDTPVAEAAASAKSTDAVVEESRLLTHIRQLTFEGRRAGEGYFSRDGRQMVFQSEREEGNPFFQIYLMDFNTGDIQRVSPGQGKTTCGWIHPDGNQVLFASTHEDPEAKQKQEQELADRASGEQRRYSWDYDDHFELYAYDVRDQRYRQLTDTRGYDAEASWSPDGSQIVFASNRQAYAEPMTKERQERIELDPSYFMDLYIMDADGGNVRQLTDVPGYDGGPFFSPDGARICWRRFSEDGARAEIMTMKVDGTDVRPITKLGAMSWAPFYHPSGKYLIFATNLHGFSNFELYVVDADGQLDPVRVTYTEGFDGLPVFTPDGKRLTWTTNRGPTGQSQLFIADWNHQRALELLGLEGEDGPRISMAALAAIQAMRTTQPDCSPQDILRHVDYLCRPELRGRRTGTTGEQLATAYVAAFFDQLALMPAGDQDNWFQNFEYTSGVSLGTNNRLTDEASGTAYEVNEQWVPLSFSNTGEFAKAPVVFAGYGIAAPATEGQEEYDSFVHLDVQDKWVLVYRFMPENVTPERRQHLARHSSLRYKAMLARDKGARGLILVSGPNSSVREELVKLRFDGSLSSSSLPVLSVSDQVAAAWMEQSGKSLKELQDKLDTGDLVMGFELNELALSARIDIEQVTRAGRNVLGRLMVGDKPTEQVVIVGAHIDHLGEGMHSSSLAKSDEREGIHWGADDNASGVAAMLEIAQWLANMKQQGKLDMKRDILFAAWSGEEDGLIGSSHFVKTFAGSARPATLPHHASAETSATSAVDTPDTAKGKAAGHGEAANVAHGDAHGGESHAHALYPQIAACLNLDMVGRLDKKLILQGIGSSSIWRGEVERRNALLGLPITLQDDSYIPTDASVFFTRGVPILSAFTGSHDEYHTPRDTPDKLNYDGAAKIARFMAMVARSIAMRDNAPDYQSQAAPQQGESRARLRAYLGTIPDYAESDVKGVKLSSVASNGPAAQAGVQGGDTIVELAGRKVENIYDYTYAIEALKIGQKTTIKVSRGGEVLTLEVTPGSRD